MYRSDPYGGGGGAPDPYGGAPPPSPYGADPYGPYGGGGGGGYRGGRGGGGGYRGGYRGGGGGPFGGDPHGDRCPFYMKMGACRHGDRCTKVHPKLPNAPTVLLPMCYMNPKLVPLQATTKHGRTVELDYDRKWLKKHLNSFFEELFMLMMEFGTIVEMIIVDNICEHLLGNVYVRYEQPEAGNKAVAGLTKKMFNGVVLMPELSPVVDFSDACCKEDRENTCQRGLMCNFLHVLTVSKGLVDDLLELQLKVVAKREAEERKNAPPPPPSAPKETDDRKRGRDDDRPRTSRRERTDSRDYHRSSRRHRDDSRDRDYRRGGDDRHRRDDRYRSDDHHRSSRYRDDSRDRDRGGYRGGGGGGRYEEEQKVRHPAPPDHRLCHICGETGHISKDCHLKNAA